jgi:MOSC domain-containing protein YiiM
LEGRGVEGDAHCGANVQHLYDRTRDPARINLRQVHLVEQELLEELTKLDFNVSPGQLGENVITRHIDLLRLEAGTILKLGTRALVRITGLREPCVKLDRFRKGLRKILTARRDGYVFMRGAVMAVVVGSGDVCMGDPIHVERPTGARCVVLHPV